MRAFFAAVMTLATVAMAPLGGCTFPDVDYGDGGAGTSSGGTCDLPSQCAADAQTCAGSVALKDEGCRTACKKNMNCLAQCDAARQTELGKCASACGGCAAAAACASAAADCMTLVGL